MKNYKIGIIDDDNKSVQLLSFYLKEYFSNITVVAVANSFNDGLAMINSTAVDLLFIDIHLNEDLGYELLDVAKTKSAAVIFISSYEKHAINVFKYNPVDYLLKPFSVKELCVAVNRAFEKINANQKVTSNDENKEVVALPVGSLIEMVKVSDIKYAESNGNLTKFYLDNNTAITANKNIGTYEELLGSQYLFRIHKKFMVNLRHIKTIYKTDGFYCQLTDGTTLDVSRRKQEPLQRLLGLK